MELRTAIKQIREKQFSPVYVLSGEESFMKEEFVSLAKREMIDPTYADLNISYYDCTEHALADILQDAETLPFLADHRLVVASRGYFLTGAKAPNQAKFEVDPAALVHYLDNPPPYTSLIIDVPGEKLDERKKIVKVLHEKATVLSFQPLKDHDLYSWVERRAKKYAALIEREEAIKLVEWVGSELRLLDKELEKMALYLGGNDAKITGETIELLAARTLEQDVFALVEAVVSGQLTQAFRIFYDCAKTGEEPIKLLALLARQFRLLLAVKVWGPRGYTQQQIANMLKVHPFAVKKAVDQARHFDEGSLSSLLTLLAEEDYRMKSGQVDKQLAIELFITRVAARVRR